MQIIKIELTITLADGGKSTREIIERNGTRVVDDIEQIAWNEYACDDRVQEQKFTGLKLDRWSVKHTRDANFQITTLMVASAETADFARHVIEEYMNGFSDWISETVNGIYSRTGVRTSFNPNPLEWNANII